MPKLLLAMLMLFAVTPACADDGGIWDCVILAFYSAPGSAAHADLQRIAAAAMNSSPPAIPDGTFAPALDAKSPDFWRGFMLGNSNGRLFSMLLRAGLDAEQKADASRRYDENKCSTLGR